MSGDGGGDYIGPIARTKERDVSFAIYLVGYLIFIGGVAWALVTMHVPQVYVGIVCLILLGLGIITGVSRTRSKDPSS